MFISDAFKHSYQDGKHPLPDRQRLLSCLQVDVQERGRGHEGGSGHHHPPQAAHLPLRGSGGAGVHGPAPPLPAAAAPGVPGVLPQRLLQHGRQDHHPSPGEKIVIFLTMSNVCVN